MINGVIGWGSNRLSFMLINKTHVVIGNYFLNQIKISLMHYILKFLNLCYIKDVYYSKILFYIYIYITNKLCQAG